MPRPMTVTGVLLATHRLDHLQDAIHCMLAEPRIKDVIVWSNRSVYRTHLLRQFLRAKVRDRRVRVLGFRRNFGRYGRYLAASEAIRSTIVTCDDHCRVDNWSELIDYHWERKRVVCNVSPHDYGRVRETGCWIHRYAGGTAFEAPLSYGACFRRESVTVLRQYLARHGDDHILHQGADQLFSLLQNRSHLMLPRRVAITGGSNTDTSTTASRRESRDRAIQILRSAAASDLLETA